MNIKGLKAWLFLVVVVIAILLSLVFLLGFAILLLPLISFMIIFGVIYAMVGRYKEKRNIRKKNKIIDVKVKEVKRGKNISVKKK
ncbi:MAG: hypothetical protein ABIA37_01940 [Candidatus Woesearchaeota archaeon]